MGRARPHRQRQRLAGGLTIPAGGDRPDAQLVAARAAVQRLAALARALVDLPCCSEGNPTAVGRDVPDHEGCRLDDVPGGRQACEIVADLARLLPPEAAPRASGDDLAGRYLRAVGDAAGVVYLCRRVEHACGHCWFSPEGPAADVCGRVLAVSHRLQARPASVLR